MNYKKITFTFMALIAPLISSGIVKAQEYQATPCDEAQYSALALLPAGNLTAYVKAGRKEDAVQSHLYYKVFDTNDCVEIGAAQMNNKSYVKFGSTSILTDKNFVSIHVKLDIEIDMQAGASIPQVVFVDTNNQPCDLAAGCMYKYNNQDFILSPKNVSLTSDNARVGVLGAISDEIKEVLYTVDGKPAYTKPTLEEFNLNYVSDGEHTIERKIVLKDGQSLTDSRVVKRGLEGGATYLFISMLYGQSKLLRFIGFGLVFIVVYSLFTFAAKHIVARRRWKNEHFFDPSEHFDMSKVGARRGITGEESYGQLLRHYKKFLLSGLGIITAVFVLNIYVLTFFTVDGVSMFPTLKDRSREPLYILPVSLGRVNKNYYLPSRGTIVVVQKDENNLFEPAGGSAEKHYVVKRIVGLPNERVVIKNGKVMVYNKQNEKGFEPDAEFNWVADLTGSEGIRMDIKLKEGEVFVVGDNRDESIDSRFYGPVQTSQVVGKVL